MDTMRSAATEAPAVQKTESKQHNPADSEKTDQGPRLIQTALETAAGIPAASRREFFQKTLTAGAWGTFLTCTGVGVYQCIRFFFPTVVFQPPSQFRIGAVSEFLMEGAQDAYGVIGVEDRFKNAHRFFIIREKQRIYALFARCTHLGCTVNWFPGIRTFKCPCHGSEFHSNGRQFAGPAPRPLDRLKISQDAESRIVVDTKQIYTKQEFEEQKMYLEVAG